MISLLTGGGSRPASRLTFLLVQESKQRTPAPTAPDPPASPAGNLSRQALETVRQNSLRAFGASFKQLPQVRSRSVCTLRCSRQPQELAVAGVVTRGNTGCGIASLSISIAATAIRDWARSQFRYISRRPSDPAPTRVDAPAARCSGCGHWHRRVSMLCDLTCGNVFERSNLLRSEFCRTAD